MASDQRLDSVFSRSGAAGITHQPLINRDVTSMVFTTIPNHLEWERMSRVDSFTLVESGKWLRYFWVEVVCADVSRLTDP